MVNSEVGPAEDVLNALLETLVGPMLSKVVTNDPPSEDNQESVAKQMHAVVLLYNYYHRKQNLDIEVLSFRDFCHLAELLRLPLGSFMKFTKENPPVELTDADNQLSETETEKAISDACNIAVSLDASKDVPITEGLPISKVAVLLIDSKGEKCFLRNGVITKGVWSLVEKKINESSIGIDMLAPQRGRKKRKTDNGHASNYDKLLLIAYEAVKDATRKTKKEIASSDLAVLENHVVHSLSEDKSATQFFIMQYSQSFDLRDSVSLKELVESLQDPLVEKNGDSWSTTKVVEFHHMLPYVGFISSLLSRKDLCSNSDDSQSIKNYDKKELPGSKDLGQVDTNFSGMKSRSADKVVNGNSEIHQNKRKHSSAGKIPDSVVLHTKEQGNVTDEYDIRDLLDKKGSKMNFAKSDMNNETHERGYLSDPLRGRSQSTVKNNNVMQRTNVSDRTRGSLKARELKSLHPKPATRRKNAPSSQHDAHRPEDVVNLVETAERPKSNVSPCRDQKKAADTGDANISPNQNGIAAKQKPLAESEALNNSVIEIAMAAVDRLKSNVILGRDERMAAEIGVTNISRNQGGTAVKENPPSKPEGLHNNTGAETVVLSATEKSAVALLYRKSQELEMCDELFLCLKTASQICPLLDKQAVIENAAERILRGGEFELARRCVQYILSGNEHLLLNEAQGHRPVEDHTDPQSQTKTRLLIPGKPSCQDLELICLSNKLLLPRYTILSSDGKYMGEVKVQINGLTYCSKSGSEGSPREARESCAAEMISRINDAYS